MGTTTVRITEETHQTLRELANTTHQSMAEVIAKAVELYEEHRFWDEVDEAYARIWADPQLTAEELAERAAWDVTLMDGLQDFPYEDGEKSG